MSDSYLAHTEPLIQEDATSHRTRRGAQVVAAVSLFVFFGLSIVVALGSGGYARGRGAIQDAMAWTKSAGPGGGFFAPAKLARSPSRMVAFGHSPEQLKKMRGHEQKLPLPTFEHGKLSDSVTTSAGLQMPRVIYDTAFMADQTENLVQSAVNAGFRGIDMSGSPKQFDQAASALGKLFDSGISRDSLFIQSQVNKNLDSEIFQGQYISSPQDEVWAWVEEAVDKLKVDYLDSLVLHLTCGDEECYPHDQTMAAWKAMEDAVEAGIVRQIGVANAQDLDQLKKIYKDATIKPAVVQQPFLVEKGFSSQMRAFCANNGMVFQSMWAVEKPGGGGADDDQVSYMPVPYSINFVHETWQKLAKKYKVSPPVLFYRFMMGNGIVPLIGTAVDKHLEEDFAALSVNLAEKDAQTLDAWMKDMSAVSVMNY
eukprot:gnl/TRDRNA2_/TRDRNA2_185271_c0_seq1.p1 gnl/TRDRNA2_/TRDRNA2_185271_c0~~gnl/TRDRNA2_/TRDRNA2_185271_c0_seq1.p1  ORF type:complete len:425 (-),score=85.74 gnl/TRDRNA2_/TRDRNA2_185271_c0_seq1:415-1689(-)